MKIFTIGFTQKKIEYIHLLDLAPTKDILEEYKKKQIDWVTYEKRFNQLITERM